MKKYLVQVSKGDGKYQTKYAADCYSAAIRWYRGVNIGNGYNKRLVLRQGEKDSIILERNTELGFFVG